MSRTRNTADLVSLNALNANGGKVGIGTTARSNQLYVEGNTQVTGVVTASSFVGDLTGSASSLGGVSSSFLLDYNNFTNTPTIPTNNNELTNGAGYITTSFTNTNQLTNGAGFVTFTNNNQLTNGAGYITTSFTNTSQLTNDAGFITTSFTNTSQLTNDAGFITNSVTGDFSVSGNISVGGTLVGNVTGDVTGTATTATNAVQLQTARNIGGVSFDGTADINLPGVNQAGNQNTSGTAANLSGSPSITVTDITAVGNVSIAGTLTYEDVNNVDSVGLVTARTGVRVTTGGIVVSNGGADITGVTTSSGGFVGDLTGDVTGTATTATNAVQLQTARNIGGVSFDGTADINLPGVNATGNQDTSGNAATATQLATARTIAGVSFDGSQDISLNNNAITNGAGYITTSFTNTSQLTNDAGFITGVSTFSGDYNDLTNTPTIPTNNNQLTNGAGYITTSFTNTNQLTNGAGFITNSVTGDFSVTGNISIGGTLTYEDVTSVDSIGIVTARSGINVTGGQLIVGTGFSVHQAGVVTATGFVGPLTGNVTGDVTGDVTGNADTATQLATARTIAGVSFDGTSDISLNNNAITNGAGYITTSFTNTSQLTNDAGFITTSFTNTSQLTNDAGFITNNVTGDFTLTDTDTGSAAGPELTLYRNSASPAPGDYLGQIMFKGENSNGGEENYAKITGKISDETLGTEDGLIETAIKGDGSFTIVSRQRSDELQLLNGVGLSVDGDSTFTGGIDVDGHTELDDVNVSGVITATSFVGDGSGLTGVASTDYIITGTAATFNNNVDFNNNIYQTGIATFGASNGIGTVHIGLGQTALFVDGNARIVGIFTVGRSSVTIDGENNTISVGLVTVTNSTIILGDNVTLNAGATGINSAPNVLYVAKDGDDTANGTSIDNAKLTIEAAVGIAQSGTVIKVLSGNYVENNPITLPAFVAVVGDDQRTVKVLPSNTTQDIFHVNKGCKLANMTFSGHLAPSAAVAFPTAGATNVGGGKWKGPYIQNCTSDTTTGTGIRVDGDKAVLTKSMNVDAFTQYNQGGVGVAITNQGYAQLVSVFTICCNEAITAHKGGQADLANSNCSFGTYGLVADGVSPEQFTGIVTSSGAVGQDNIVVNVGAVTTRPYDGQVVYFDQLYKSVETITITSGGSGYTSTPSVSISSPTGPNGEVATAFATIENGVVTEIDIISSGSQYTGTATVTISAPDSGTTATATANMADTYYTINSSTPITAGITTLTLAENLLNTVGVGSTAYFFQQSKIIASSHTFEYIGSGNDITSATPKRGGVTIQANEVVTQNGGSVIYTSTDQSGNFRIGDEFQINQSTGTISGRAFSKSLFSEMTPFILALS